MDEQPVSDQRFIHVVQSRDGYSANVDARSRMHGERHVQRLRRRILVSDRSIHLRQRVSVFLQRGEQSLLRFQHVRGKCGRSGRDAELAAFLVGYLAVDLHVAKVIERAKLDCHRHLGVGVLGNGFDCSGQLRIVELSSVHRDVSPSLVIAVSLQNGLQAVHVLLGAGNQRKWTDRPFGPQRFR